MFSKWVGVRNGACTGAESKGFRAENGPARDVAKRKLSANVAGRMVKATQWLLRIGTSFNGQAAIAVEAERLIARFKDQAYFEARDRVHGRCIDGDRSRRYWIKVKLEIARRQQIGIGLAGADSWA
jgi:hypothetical protein